MCYLSTCLFNSFSSGDFFFFSEFKPRVQTFKRWKSSFSLNYPKFLVSYWQQTIPFPLIDFATSQNHMPSLHIYTQRLGSEIKRAKDKRSAEGQTPWLTLSGISWDSWSWMEPWGRHPCWLGLAGWSPLPRLRRERRAEAYPTRPLWVEVDHPIPLPHMDQAFMKWSGSFACWEISRITGD